MTVVMERETALHGAVSETGWSGGRLGRAQAPASLAAPRPGPGAGRMLHRSGAYLAWG